MSDLVSTAYPKARKDYPCDSCEFLINNNCWKSSGELSIDDFRVIVKAKKNGWQIKKGDVYLKQTLRHENELCYTRNIPEVHAICSKYDLFRE